MPLHEERKFREWASKVESYIESRDYKLRESCQRLIYWAKRIREFDESYYTEKIRSYEFSLISRALPIIYGDYYNQYLLGSKKHGKFTKARQEKIGSFVYHFASFLLPIAEEINEKNFLKEKIQVLVKEYLPDLLFNLSNVDEHEIQALLKLALTAEELGIEVGLSLRKAIETEILTRQLEKVVVGDLEGESVQVEFKEEIPDDIHKLVKEIAAFASTEGGRIYLGITDDGEIVGVQEKGPNWYDKLQQRIENAVYESVKPVPTLMVNPYQIGDKMVVQISIPKGSEPIYYLKRVPYVRRLTTSRPATPEEVKRLHLRYFIETLEKSSR